MTLEELRAKAKEDFKDPATKRFWMDAVNKMLEKRPGFMGLTQPITPEQIGLPSDAEKIQGAISANVAPKTEKQLSFKDETSPEVQFKHAFSYFYNVPPDYAEAVKWFRMAADQGHCRAQGYLGQCYAKGEGVVKDDVESTSWYRKAADQGDDCAQYILGYCYANGQGVTKDFIEAEKWFGKAAEQGHKEAQSHLEKLKTKLNTDTQTANSNRRLPKIKVSFSETERNIFRFARNIFFRAAKIVQVIAVIVIVLVIMYLIHKFGPSADYGFWRP